MGNKGKSFLTTKKKHFAEKVFGGATAKDAALTTYDTTPRNARLIGTRLLQDPSVKNYLDQKFKETYPDLEDDLVKHIKIFLKTEMNLSEGIKPSEFIAMLRELAKIKGWNAPEKTLHANLKDVAKMLELPGEEKEIKNEE